MLEKIIVTSDELSENLPNGNINDYEILEVLYSASFTEEDYRIFRQQQGLFVELKDFPSYLDKEILGNDKISIELSTHGEPSFNKQVK